MPIELKGPDSNLVPIKIEFPNSIVILFAVGWIVILFGLWGNSTFIEMEPFSRSNLGHHDPIEPWYSVSTAVIGIGFMFLAIFHLLINMKFKFASSIASIPIMMVTCLYLLIIAQDNLSGVGVINSTLEEGGIFVFGLIMVIALGMHGFELFLFGNSHFFLKIWGRIMMFLGLPLVIVYFISARFQTYILILALFVLAITLSLYRLNLRGVWHFQGRVIPHPPKRTKRTDVLKIQGK